MYLIPHARTLRTWAAIPSGNLFVETVMSPQRSYARPFSSVCQPSSRMRVFIPSAAARAASSSILAADTSCVKAYQVEYSASRAASGTGIGTYPPAFSIHAVRSRTVASQRRDRRSNRMRTE